MLNTILPKRAYEEQLSVWRPMLKGTRRSAIITCRKGHDFHLSKFRVDANDNSLDDGVSCPICTKEGLGDGFCKEGHGFHQVTLLGFHDAFGPGPYCAWLREDGQMHVAAVGSAICLCGDDTEMLPQSEGVR